ncbi:MAG: ABC transporter permease [Oscillospiraceae bacterium]|nr:ABC transporter permease [Oscillospiraceae bacterium]
MQGRLEAWFPNVMARLPEFYKAIRDTLTMFGIAGAFVLLFGLFFGVMLVTTRKGGILENAVIYQILDKAINVFRSIPFIILLTLLLPLTRLIMGTAIGVKGAIVPLVIGTTPFFSRQVEAALSEISSGVVEAAQSIGMSPAGIIFRVYLREGIPMLARAATITAISLIGATAMAGAVGAGGLGDFAIRYGHNRFMTDITWVTCAALVLLVCVVQIVGSLIAKLTTH